MLKKIVPSFLALALCGVSQSALSHTTIRDAATEGGTHWTVTSISHGCGASHKEDNLTVKAMAMVFPNATDSIITDVDGNSVDLSTVMSGANDHNGGLTILSPRVIQDKNVFQNIEPVKDSNGNVHGIRYTNGELQDGLTGLTPWRASIGSFVPESCAKKIVARIAIANWCSNGTGARRADIWMGKLTTLFNDAGVVSEGFWPALTINRDLSANPLPESCGEGFDVFIEPSNEDIDANLPIPGYWPTL